MKRMALHTKLRAELADFFFDRFAEGIGVAIETKILCTAILDELAQALERIAIADDQSAADRLEIFGKRREAAAEEMLALGSGPQVGFFPIAQKINRDHRAAQRGSMMQREVVGDAQIATVPMDDGGIACGHGRGHAGASDRFLQQFFRFTHERGAELAADAFCAFEHWLEASERAFGCGQRTTCTTEFFVGEVAHEGLAATADA
ncbi:MAG: hypothetical protein NTU84_02250 [Verrucomicrobia bacterium]|nr:hypothetical protein [Verrucomicrobiota bacterium]